MDEERIKLLLELGVEVDENGKVKKLTDDINLLQKAAKQLQAYKTGNSSAIKRMTDSAFPDENKINKATQALKVYSNLLNEVNSKITKLQSASTSIPNFETTGLSEQDVKNANNIGKSISIPSGAKLIQESYLTNAKGEQTWVGIFQQFVEEDGKRLVKTYKQIGDEIRVETNKIRKGFVGHTAADNPLIGELYKTKLNPENNDVIQWTKELNGNLQITRKYINGVLVDTQKLIKAEKKPKQEPKPEPEPIPTPKKNSFDKFIARVKNIVVYRLVREVMSAVQKSITEGFNLISVNNSSVKNMLTEFKASSVSLSVSLSTMLLPIMQSLSSLLNTIGMQFIDVANEMSRQNAIAKGQATYYKINKDAVNDYAKSLTQLSGNLSQLDKFATLSGTNTPILGGNVDIAEQSGITEESQGKLKLFQKILKGIGNLISYVEENFDKVINTIKTFILLIVGSQIAIGISNLVKGFGSILDFIKNIKIQSLLLYGGLAMLAVAFTSDLPIAIKALVGALGGLAIALSIIVGLKEATTKSVGAIISIGAILGAVAGLASGVANLIDSGSSATSSDLSSATNISSLMGGVASSGSYSQSVSVAGGSNSVQGDVYLDGYKVGNILSQRINTNFTKAGYAKGR